MPLHNNQFINQHKCNCMAWKVHGLPGCHDCITNNLAVCSTFLGNKSGGCTANTVACAVGGYLCGTNQGETYV